jgi:type II secretory pathway pseudopilin PulG
MKKTGLTLTENLVALLLLTIIAMTSIGGFVIAKMGATRANHRTVAMGIIREFLEGEVSSASQNWVAGYVNTAPPARTIDGITYNIALSPAMAGDTPENRACKIIGFRVTWNEPILGGAGNVQCSEQAVTYVARHI